MEEYIFENPHPKTHIIIGATGMGAIMQNIRIIIMSTRYSVPLDRGFAHTADAIDTPSPRTTALYVAKLMESIEMQEPRVKVTSISFDPQQDIMSGMDGRLSPIVKFCLKEGVTL